VNAPASDCQGISTYSIHSADPRQFHSRSEEINGTHKGTAHDIVRHPSLDIIALLLLSPRIQTLLRHPQSLVQPPSPPIDIQRERALQSRAVNRYELWRAAGDKDDVEERRVGVECGRRKGGGREGVEEGSRRSQRRHVLLTQSAPDTQTSLVS
jgi:hypothetical protein